MTNSIRISKQLGKRYPEPVVKQINFIASAHKIKSFKAETVQPDKKFYVAEGDKFIGINTDGSGASFETVASHNIGASGLSHKIGEQFSMPPGTYLINVYYYTKYFMTVYHIEPDVITA